MNGRPVYEALCSGAPGPSANAYIDMRALPLGPEATDAEVERRMTLAWKEGRYTPALDHGAPPDNSWHDTLPKSVDDGLSDHLRSWHCPAGESLIQVTHG